MRFLLAASACIVSASVAAAAEPAMINKVVGKNVIWQHGEVEGSPRVQTLLAAGDTVTAGKESSAVVEYLADRCIVRVEAGQTASISSTSPCAASAQKTLQVAQEPVIVPTSAPIVEVTAKKGPVTQVNRGSGMKAAKLGDSLKAGDQVFAGKDSSVSLYFTQAQCTYTVKGSAVYKVTNKAPCKAGAAAGTGAGAGAAAGMTTGVAVGAGALAIGGAIAVIANSEGGNSNNNPITPN